MKKNKKKGKIIAIAAAAVILTVIIIVASTGDKNEYNSMTVKNRDIVTYFNFSGNIQAEKSHPVIASQSLKVKSVNVSEGDKINEGDIIAVLDSEEIEKQIRTQESNIEVNNINLTYAYSQSQKNYNEANEKYENGLNTEINNAQNAVEAVRLSLETSKKKYDDAQKNLNDQSNSAILQAKADLEPAEINYRVAKEDYYKRLNENSYPEITEKVLVMEDKLTALQAQIDVAKAEMRKNQGINNTAVEEAAQKLNDAQENYDDMLEDIYNEINGYSIKIARNKMEEYKKIYDNTKDALNDTIQSVDVNLSDLKSAVDNSQLNYDKAQTMLQITELTVKQQLESLKDAMEKDKKVIDNQPALLELANLKSKLDDCVIKSDFSGTVTSVYAKEGTMVSMGQTIADIIDSENLEVQIKVDEYDVTAVEVGADVIVYINSLDKEIEGKVRSVSESASVQNGMAFFTAEISISDFSDLKSGMSAEVKLLNANSENTPALPMSALRFDDDNSPFVYIKENGKIIEKYISVGINDGNWVEITEGLNDGDTVYIPKSLGMSMFEMMGM